MDKIPDSKNGHIFVDNEKSLALLVQAMAGAKRVGLDTEADSLHHYFEKVCLIQLSFGKNHYVIDPLAGLSLSPFIEALAETELILQGADYDLRMMKKSFGFRPNKPVFDTMIASQVLGYEKIGLAALAEKFCGVVLSKSSQKSDWSRRPLSAGLLAYASDDTRYLEIIADAQTEELKKLNRLRWHEEACARAVRAAALPERNESKEDPWRIKGCSKMPPGVLVYVREIWKWRDELARKKDRPPFMILRNEDFLEVVDWASRNPEKPLKDGPAFLKRLGDHFIGLEAAIFTARGSSPAEWPLPPKREPWPEKLPNMEKLEPLMAACKTIAAQLKIESSVLASRSMLTAVIQHRPDSLEKLVEVSGMMQWQAELLLPTIKTVLSK